MKSFKFFIDMDGVFVDFLQGCADYFKPIRYGISTVDLYKEWPKGEWGDDKILQKVFGCSGQAFWEHIGFKAFFEFLPYMKDGLDFLEFIDPLKPVILTSPCQNSADGKIAWVRRNLREYYKDGRMMIGRGKHYLAGFNRVLIDDSDLNIQEWCAKGGTGILYPRPWNAQHAIKNPLRHVKNRVNAIIKMGD